MEWKELMSSINNTWLKIKQNKCDIPKIDLWYQIFFTSLFRIIIWFFSQKIYLVKFMIGKDIHRQNVAYTKGRWM